MLKPNQNQTQLTWISPDKHIVKLAQNPILPTAKEKFWRFFSWDESG